ncbi:hypothetical protein [Legionella jordanis]|uniref:Uncharacterized protein n=1 Tax=Legionella jordanis TaxID=456 RepID=A0A0W0VCL1_9GAMM|nr:hypothetical protein [Legionella jordanis]KTD17590.1 hypothetical protein Ljor_1896 [Legionella jordanis]RMX00873.1 hypothetical protein EAW55_11900 [Legionella jordanis]VEH11488.1 Uncharacterised protein [Legionella jordanis]HAT8714894.1 hypothetical protein [Legionella jordanis]
MLSVSNHSLFKKQVPHFPNIQFIWIGPPKTTDPANPDMDLAGPLQFYDSFKKHRLDHKIMFYCLDEYCQSFSTLFPPAVDIEIRGLESCFMANEDKLKDYKLTEAVSIFNENKSGDVHEKVSAKNLASLLVLYLYGDYFLDTTIFPMKDAANFGFYSYFQAPLLSEDRLNILSCENLDVFDQSTAMEMPFPDRSFYVNLLPFDEEGRLEAFEKKCLQKLTGRSVSQSLKKQRTMDIDCFILFSPQYSLQVAQAISCFVYFYPLVRKQKMRSKAEPENNELQERYHKSDDDLMLLSITNGYYLHSKRRQEKWYADLYDWDEHDDPSRLVNPLNIKKVFKGSHVARLPYGTDEEDDGIVFTY